MKHAILALSLGLGSAAAAETAMVTPFDGSFDDATFAVESAIVGRGLVIDYVSHVGEMLERTGADVGSDKTIFKAADVFLFCSAVLSRKVMESDPMNIVHCPYGIFVAETDDGVVIGHRDYPEGPMDEVEALLSGIIEEAVAN
jgi:uncharacterized protein (DUF302 family)